jgi:hypothetical protein
LLERALHALPQRKIRPTGNDDAILRWNRCVRLLQTPSLSWEEQLASFEAEDAPPRWVQKEPPFPTMQSRLQTSPDLPS